MSSPIVNLRKTSLPPEKIIITPQTDINSSNGKNNRKSIEEEMDEFRKNTVIKKKKLVEEMYQRMSDLENEVKDIKEQLTTAVKVINRKDEEIEMLKEQLLKVGRNQTTPHLYNANDTASDDEYLREQYDKSNEAIKNMSPREPRKFYRKGDVISIKDGLCEYRTKHSGSKDEECGRQTGEEKDYPTYAELSQGHTVRGNNQSRNQNKKKVYKVDTDELEEVNLDMDEMLSDNMENYLDHLSSRYSLGSSHLKNGSDYQRENSRLAAQIDDMEKFLSDYRMIWVGEKTVTDRIHGNITLQAAVGFTPDFDKLILTIGELNLRASSEKHIKVTGNEAKFQKADMLNLTFYNDGMQLEDGPFRSFSEESVQAFFQDLGDGYYPTELKESHPEGLIFKVIDKRSIKYREVENGVVPYEGQGYVLGTRDPPNRKPGSHVGQQQELLVHQQDISDHQKEQSSYRQNSTDHQKEPSDHRQKPTDLQKEPSDHLQKPTDHQKEPSDHLQNLTYYQKKPSNHLQKPTDHQKKPSDHRQNSTYHQKKPPNHLQNPTDHQKEPSDHLQKPTYHQNKPSDHRQEYREQAIENTGTQTEMYLEEVGDNMQMKNGSQATQSYEQRSKMNAGPPIEQFRDKIDITNITYHEAPSANVGMVRHIVVGPTESQSEPVLTSRIGRESGRIPKDQAVKPFLIVERAPHTPQGNINDETISQGSEESEKGKSPILYSEYNNNIGRNANKVKEAIANKSAKGPTSPQNFDLTKRYDHMTLLGQGAVSHDKMVKEGKEKKRESEYSDTYKRSADEWADMNDRDEIAEEEEEIRSFDKHKPHPMKSVDNDPQSNTTIHLNQRTSDEQIQLLMLPHDGKQIYYVYVSPDDSIEKIWHLTKLNPVDFDVTTVDGKVLDISVPLKNYNINGDVTLNIIRKKRAHKIVPEIRQPSPNEDDGNDSLEEDDGPPQISQPFDEDGYSS